MYGAIKLTYPSRQPNIIIPSPEIVAEEIIL